MQENKSGRFFEHSVVIAVKAMSRVHRERSWHAVASAVKSNKSSAIAGTVTVTNLSTSPAYRHNVPIRKTCGKQ